MTFTSHLSNLPPGVTNRMIEDAFGENEVVLRCERCGGFLRWAPTRIEMHDDTLACDGMATEYQMAYTDGLVAILGEEYRGRSYPVIDTPCGREAAHEPHTEVLGGWADEHRVCKRCGTDNVARVA